MPLSGEGDDFLSPQGDFTTNLQNTDYFGSFYKACTRTNELPKLTAVLNADWSEQDLADFARWNSGQPFFAIGYQSLAEVVHSAFNRDYLARWFLKERGRRPARVRPYPFR